MGVKIRGPFPLVRTVTSSVESNNLNNETHGGSVSSTLNTSGPKLELRSEGLDMLQRLPDYRSTIVFAIGGSRVGKSTLGNELLRCNNNSSSSTHHGFNIGHSFEPVTQGVDVAALVDSDQKRILVYCDCEGSFHPHCKTIDNNSHISNQNQNYQNFNSYDFGPLGLLAYCCSDWLMHISMGNVDERDIENLAYLAAGARKHVVHNNNNSTNFNDGPGPSEESQQQYLSSKDSSAPGVPGPPYVTLNDLNQSSSSDLESGHSNMVTQQSLAGTSTTASLIHGSNNSNNQSTSKTKLMILINAPRFDDLAKDPTRVLSKAFEPSNSYGVNQQQDSRFIARRTIAQQFGERKYICMPQIQDGLMNLQYRNAIDQLRSFLVYSDSNTNSSNFNKTRLRGTEIGIFFKCIIDELNQRQHVHPVSAVDMVARQLYITPISEKILSEYRKGVHQIYQELGGPHMLRQAGILEEKTSEQVKQAGILEEKTSEFDRFLSKLDASKDVKRSERLAFLKKLNQLRDTASLEGERMVSEKRKQDAIRSAEAAANAAVVAARNSVTNNNLSNLLSLNLGNSNANVGNLNPGSNPGNGPVPGNSGTQQQQTSMTSNEGGTSSPTNSYVGGTHFNNVKTGNLYGDVNALVNQNHSSQQTQYGLTPKQSYNNSTNSNNNLNSSQNFNNYQHSISARCSQVSTPSCARLFNADYDEFVEKVRAMNTRIEAVNRDQDAKYNGLAADLDYLRERLQSLSSEPRSSKFPKVDRLITRLDELEPLAANSVDLLIHSKKMLAEVQSYLRQVLLLGSDSSESTGDMLSMNSKTSQKGLGQGSSIVTRIQNSNDLNFISNTTNVNAKTVLSNVRSRFDALQTELESVKSKTTLSSSKLDNSISDVAEALVTATKERENMHRRVEQIFEEKQEMLMHLLEQEREDREVRSKVRQDIVETMSVWITETCN